MLKLLEEQLGSKEPSVILDVGCGTGRFLRAAASKWPKTHLFGVDPAPQMVSEARRVNPNATLLVASAESLPLTDQSAEIVVTTVSFHHWADQEQGVHEIARVLRPGGLFCLADHAFLPARLLEKRVKSRGSSSANDVFRPL
jgi:ubiquinone/menaquinone biosynthesis C-methylase UbiE